jgi:DNA topoisomerase IB
LDVDSRDVNDYIEHVAGFPYTAKDFRTWGGTLRAATVLAELGKGKSQTERKKNVVTAVRLVAAELGNTPTICRKSTSPNTSAALCRTCSNPRRAGEIHLVEYGFGQLLSGNR